MQLEGTMDKRTIFLYWGGEQYIDKHGLCYRGKAKTAIVVSGNMTYNELAARIYQKMGVDVTEVRLKLTCRYPYIIGAGAEIFYEGLEINDDDTVEAMLVAGVGVTTRVELYVETEAVVGGWVSSQS